ncbi:MAG: hypothetical protein HOE90_21675 [Bacteriovoracaceae bacterium]|nr:hypothetical protein [Bacteriovoracaceae bacterium]
MINGLIKLFNIKDDENFFKRVLVISFFFHLLASYFSKGFHHFDEHFQILEFINYKMGAITSADLPWEFRYQIRDWIAIFMFYPFAKLFALTGLDGPFTQAFIYRFLSMILAFLGTNYFILKSKVWFKDNINWKFSAIAMNLAWFAPYIHARTSSENHSLAFMLAGLGVYLAHKNIKGLLLSGILIGFSFWFRYQIGMGILFFVLWVFIIDRPGMKNIFALGLGGLAAFVIGVGIDYWGYGELVFTFYKYFVDGVINDKASYFGVTPYWDYLRLLFNRGIPPLSLTLMLTTIYFWYKNPKHMLSWILLPFFILHSIVPHKELRFLFFLIALSPMMLALGFESIPGGIRSFYQRYLASKWIKIATNILVFMNIVLLLAVCFRSANRAMGFYEFLYYHDEVPQKIYSLGGDPQKLVTLYPKFYLKNIRNFTAISDTTAVTAIEDQEFWIFTNRGHQLKSLIKDHHCEIKFSNYPLFLLEFNIGGWMNRSRVWALSKCNSSME